MQGIFVASCHSGHRFSVLSAAVLLAGLTSQAIPAAASTSASGHLFGYVTTEFPAPVGSGNPYLLGIEYTTLTQSPKLWKLGNATATGSIFADHGPGSIPDFEYLQWEDHAFALDATSHASTPPALGRSKLVVEPGLFATMHNTSPEDAQLRIHIAGYAKLSASMTGPSTVDNLALATAEFQIHAEDSSGETVLFINRSYEARAAIGQPASVEETFGHCGFTNPDCIWNFTLKPGEIYRLYNDRMTLETVAHSPGIPEPAAWTLMVSGFGLTGVAVRRQQRRVVAAGEACNRNPGELA